MLIYIFFSSCDQPELISETVRPFSIIFSNLKLNITEGFDPGDEEQVSEACSFRESTGMLIWC